MHTGENSPETKFFLRKGKYLQSWLVRDGWREWINELRVCNAMHWREKPMWLQVSSTWGYAIMQERLKDLIWPKSGCCFWWGSFCPKWVPQYREFGYTVRKQHPANMANFPDPLDHKTQSFRCHSQQHVYLVEDTVRKHLGADCRQLATGFSQGSCCGTARPRNECGPGSQIQNER